MRVEEACLLPPMSAAPLNPQNVLKLGFQIPTDLKAIAAALNTATPLDQGPCAVVRPCVDIGVLSKFLRFRGVAGDHSPAIAW